MRKMIILLFLMQITSMLATGLLAISDTQALIVRGIIGASILYLYLKELTANPYLIATSLLLIVVFAINRNFTSINILFTVWLIFLMRRPGPDEIIKVIFYSTLLFSIIFCAFIVKGVIHPDIVYIMETGRYRNNLGFWSANYPGFISFSCFMTLLCCIGYLRSAVSFKYRLIAFIVMSVCFFTPWIADSRTPGYAMIISLVFFVCVSLRPIRKFAILFLPFVPLLMFSLTVYLSKLHGGKIDFLLSGRLSYYNDYLSNIDPMSILIGSPLPDFALDSSYLVLFSAFGVFYLLAITYLLYKATTNNPNKYFITLIFSVLCYGFTEAVMARSEIPVVILFMSLMFIKTKSSYSKTQTKQPA